MTAKVGAPRQSDANELPTIARSCPSRTQGESLVGACCVAAAWDIRVSLVCEVELDVGIGCWTSALGLHGVISTAFKAVFPLFPYSADPLLPFLLERLFP